MERDWGCVSFINLSFGFPKKLQSPRRVVIAAKSRMHSQVALPIRSVSVKFMEVECMHAMLISFEVHVDNS